MSNWNLNVTFVFGNCHTAMAQVGKKLGISRFCSEA